MTTLHVVGAGLSGLSAAIHACRAGPEVRIYEAASRAGGRCRTYHDTQLERSIDNGAHLVLGANRNALGFLDRIGARAEMIEIEPARFPMLDLTTGQQWRLAPNAGPLPWWIFSRERRTPDAGALQHLASVKLVLAGRNATVADVLSTADPLFQRLWLPFCAAVLNTEPETASAKLLGQAVLQTFLAGERASRPYIARRGIGAAFVEPALAQLGVAGARVLYGTRLKSIETRDGRASALVFEGLRVDLEPGDGVIVAVPPALARELVPGLAVVPDETRAIVNAHYRLDRAARLPGGMPFLGLVGGTAHWLFQRDDVVSVTVSAADDLAEEPAEATLALLWRDVARALGLDGVAVPPARLIKERRATFAQSPAQLRRRPGPMTRLANLMLAGDWTDTGLPATIDGAIASGRTAVETWLARGR